MSEVRALVLWAFTRMSCDVDGARSVTLTEKNCTEVQWTRPWVVQGPCANVWFERKVRELICLVPSVKFSDVYAAGE